MVLSSAVFHGHALGENLKRIREGIEAAAWTRYGVPYTGVKANHQAHIWGHFATKSLPCLAFAAWCALLGLICWSELFNRSEPFKMRQVPPSMEYAGSICNFPPGSESLDGNDKEIKNALDRVTEKWREGVNSGKKGTIILIGATDRVQLSGPTTHRFEDSSGLARARAETIRGRLAGKDGPGEGQQIMMLISGPEHTPPIDSDARRYAFGYPEDRRVDVWYLWGGGWTTEQTLKPALTKEQPQAHEGACDR
jgi:hypothetical protein